MLRISSSWQDASAGQQREGRGGLGERGLVSPNNLSFSVRRSRSVELLALSFRILGLSNAVALAS
jgi:hypothetical protein